MLVLVILQIATLILFIYNLRLYITPGFTRIIFLRNLVSEDLKKPETLCRVSALVETGADQNTGSCMPPKLEMPYQYL